MVRAKMNFKHIQENLFLGIKILSTVLISSAVGLEIWNIQLFLTNQTIPNSLNWILLIAHFALSAHFVEGIFAAFHAPTKNKNAIQYGTYTFFVGTVSLLELFAKNEP